MSTQVPKYCLGVNYVSTAGLNLQYSLVQKVLNGRLLEPEIPFAQPNLMIADIPCGTCLWLLDLSKEVHHTTKLEGFDLNLGQGPGEAWMPSNISLANLNLFEEPPAELRGRYDIIHMSLVVCFVDDSRVPQVLRNLFSMLKDGGHIQWAEMSISETKYESAIPGYEPVALTKAIDRAWEIARWNSPRWLGHMDRCLSEAGFESAKLDVPEIPRYLGRAFADGELLGFNSILTTAQEGGQAVDEQQAEEFTRMAQDAAREVTEKQIGCFPKIIVATARKPGSLAQR